MSDLTPEAQRKQIQYRDARFTNQYDAIWQGVGKCVFCDLRDKYVIHEENGVVLTITLFAYIDGHMMILPRRHVDSPKELTSEEWEAIRKMMYIARKLIKKVHKVKGIQFVQKEGADAQATVGGHLHYHAVPFNAPDLNVWNYRRLTYTPLENARLYQNARKEIAKLSAKFDTKYQEEVPAETGSPYDLDWSQLAFGSKKPLSALQATFIAAPRELSSKRLASLVKTYLPKGNIVLGLAKEQFVDGFDGQPQFRTLQKTSIQKLLDKINAASPTHKIYTLSYFQREAKYILEKAEFQKVILVNGSWFRSFHTREEYYTLANRQLPYELVSPFVDEDEARAYEQRIAPELPVPKLRKNLTEAEMMQAAAEAAKSSFDYSFQTGVALGKKTKAGYSLLATTFNKVIPFQTYAMHYGASREKHFSPPHDLNHYDAVHAEVELLVKAQKEGTNLKGTTLFINLLPCPACARMFCETDIKELVYAHDHSDGYAVEMLEKEGKTVRRITYTTDYAFHKPQK
ncbi:MAG TPA: deaminase [Candidatus Saccharimonadales bacterium]|nr:deaminase [Candidatus Saccharimonadales bacterium]